VPISKIYSLFAQDNIGPKARDVSAKDRERVFFLLAQMFRAGQPGEASLRTVAKSFKIEKKDDIYHALNAIAHKVSQGRALSKACELEPILFTNVHRAAILAGEAANEMYLSFKTLQELELQKINTNRSSKSELLTPALMLVFSLISIFNTGLNTLPQMVRVSEQEGKSSSGAVDFVMHTTAFFANNWHYMLGIIATLLIVFFSMIKTPKGKYWLDNLLVSMPLYGKFLTYEVYNSMLLYFPRLISSGVKPKQMIPIMKALSTNMVLVERVDIFNQVLTNGGQISEALEKAGFPEIAVTPVRVSEHYTAADSEVNDAMVEGMEHSHAIISRYLEEAQNFYITSVSVFLWIAGGVVMLLDMLSIIFSQNI
jgi:type IV pilus assembly protein PilC